RCEVRVPVARIRLAEVDDPLWRERLLACGRHHAEPAVDPAVRSLDAELIGAERHEAPDAPRAVEVLDPDRAASHVAVHPGQHEQLAHVIVRRGHVEHFGQLMVRQPRELVVVAQLADVKRRLAVLLRTPHDRGVGIDRGSERGVATDVDGTADDERRLDRAAAGVARDEGDGRGLGLMAAAVAGWSSDGQQAVDQSHHDARRASYPPGTSRSSLARAGRRWLWLRSTNSDDVRECQESSPFSSPGKYTPTRFWLRRISGASAYRTASHPWS